MEYIKFNNETFNSMMKVTQDTDNFWAKEFYKNGKKFIIFDYSHAIPERFASKHAIEMRGSMFEVTEDNKFVSAVCRPFEKFFNSHEFNYSEELCNSLSSLYGYTITTDIVEKMITEKNYKAVFEKRDGSIISSFMIGDDLYLKSAASLDNEYVDTATALLEENIKLYDKVKALTKKGFTVIMEYTSSNVQHRIVVEYEKSSLTVLAVRDVYSGEYVDYDDLYNYFDSNDIVKEYHVYDDSVLNQENTEGVIILFENNFRIKHKNSWYLERHHIFDIIRKPKDIWRFYLENKIDEVLDTIEKEDHIRILKEYITTFESLYNNIIYTGVCYFENNKGKTPAEYFKELRYSNFGSASYKVAEWKYKGMDIEEIHKRISEMLATPALMSEHGIQKYIEIAN